MAGITLCTGVKAVTGLRGQICPKRQQCYRYTAARSVWSNPTLNPVPFQMYEGRIVCPDFWNKDEH